METFTLFGWNIAEFFSADRIAAFVRFSILLFVGLPLVYALSKWANRYATKRISAQQGMIFGKMVKYIGLVIILFSALNEFGFQLTHLFAAAGIALGTIGMILKSTGVAGSGCKRIIVNPCPFESV